MGCQSQELVDPRAPVPTNVARDDLVRYSKRDFQACTTSFYRDDWPQAAAIGKRLVELGQRWQEQTPPGGQEKEFASATAAFTEAAAGVHQAAEKKDVVQMTLGLRKLAAAIAGLERFPRPQAAPETTTGEPLKDEPSPKAP